MGVTNSRTRFRQSVDAWKLPDDRGKGDLRSGVRTHLASTPSRPIPKCGRKTSRAYVGET